MHADKYTGAPRPTRSGSCILVQLPALGPEATLVGSLLDAGRSATLSLLEEVADAEMDVRFAPGAQTVTEVVAALVRHDLRWIAETFAGYEVSSEAWDALGGPWGKEGWEASLRLTRSELVARLDELRHTLRQTLRMSRDMALDSDYLHPAGDQDAAEGRWILYHGLSFEAEARGRIRSVLGLIRAAR